jgi:hypothetical protein
MDSTTMSVVLEYLFPSESIFIFISATPKPDLDIIFTIFYNLFSSLSIRLPIRTVSILFPVISRLSQTEPTPYSAVHTLNCMPMGSGLIK